MQNLKKMERAVKRYPTKLSDKKMTDQSLKKSCCINNIVNQFIKTGNLPENSKIPQYLDVSHVPTLEESYDVVKRASDTFYTLPATLRRLIDNDPSKLLSFIADSENKEICLKYGLIEKPAHVATPQQSDKIPQKEVENVTKNSNGQSSTDSWTS